MKMNTQRYEVPTKPGVYRSEPDSALGVLTVQLGEDGQWWPYPFSFSAWRESELSLVQLKSLPHVSTDIPDIPDPELRERHETLLELLKRRFPNSSAKQRKEAAQELMTFM